MGIFANHVEKSGLVGWHQIRLSRIFVVSRFKAVQLNKLNSIILIRRFCHVGTAFPPVGRPGSNLGTIGRYATLMSSSEIEP